MVEKLVSFLPPIIVLLFIVVILLCFSRLIVSRLFDKEKLKDPEYVAQWSKEHKLKTILISTLSISLYAPALEELIFRAPLIIIFDTVAGYAWIGILVSSVVFAVIHLFGKFSEIIFEGTKEAFIASEELGEEEIDDFESSREGFIKRVNRSRLLSSFLVGILSGYLGIKHQSLYLCFGIHAAWNLLFPLLLTILFLIVMLAWTFISAKIDDLKWSFRKRRIKNNY